MSESDDSVDDALRRFGLPAKATDRSRIIADLQEQIRLEVDEEGDQSLMRVLCAQLFSLGVVEDSLVIWNAKSSNFDTCLGIDVQFLCGAGLEETKQFLETAATDASLRALKYITECETSGDFDRYPLKRVLDETKAFYGVK